MSDSLLSPEEINGRLMRLEARGFPPSDIKRFSLELAKYSYGEVAESTFLGLIDRIDEVDDLVEVMNGLASRLWPREELSLERDPALLLSDLARRGFDHAVRSMTGVELRWRGFAGEEKWRVHSGLKLRGETAVAAAGKVLGIALTRTRAGGSSV